MYSILMILSMAIIGAIIGGMTNSLAIKMLFRPYNPVYIGKWRLPFTPGLIPKRRKELAKQLGYLVVNHLVTPETVQKKLAEGSFLHEIKLFVRKNIRNFLNSNRSLTNWSQYIHLEIDPSHIQQKIYKFMDDQLEIWLNNNRNKTLNGFIPLSIWSKIDKNTERLSKIILDKLIVFVKSERGKLLIYRTINKYLEQIKFSQILQMFINEYQLTTKVQMEIISFLQSDSSRKQLAEFIQEEIDRLKARTLSEILEKIGERDIKEAITKNLHQAVDITAFLDQPISNYFESPEKEQLEIKLSETIVQFGVEQLSKHIHQIMDKLQIVEMVEKQVDSFSTKRLEELVLTISGRELKMITYLGAYLGGMIGLVQGIIVQLFN